MSPLFWMAYYLSPNHIQVDIYETPQKVLTGFNGRSMVTIFPESTLYLLSAVVFLSCAARQKLN